MLYRVVSCSNIVQFEFEVNQLIAEGWRPQGGAFSERMEPDEHPCFTQAMVFWQPADAEEEWVLKPFWRRLLYRQNPRKHLQLDDERKNGRRWR